MPSSFITALGLLLIGWSMRLPVTAIPPVLDRLGLGPSGQTFLVAVPVLSFGIGALAGPKLRLRFGEERAIFGLALVNLLGIGLRAIWPGTWLFAGTILATLAIAALNVLTPTLIKRRFPNHLGGMMAAYAASLTSGAALGAGTTVPLLHFSGSLAVALGLSALPAVVGLALWTRQLAIAPPRARSFGESRPRPLWHTPLAWWVLIYMAFPGVLIFYGPMSWLPEIFASRGVSPAEAGFLVMAMSLSSFIGNFLAPLIAMRMRDQRLVVSANLALSLAGLLGVWLAPPAWALFWMVLFGISQGAGFSLSLLLIVLRGGDVDTAARLSGMTQAGGYTIGGLGTLVMGLLHSVSGGWTAPLLFLALAMAASWPVALAAGRNITIGARG